ncbi:uncharacterized protein LOC108475214 [Gossypium arboreum]|uniref:uncharacterized protein LOC108475214 n=1 Tax=Gossypium arboreum TaxID=29729 RepID=UPI0008195C54|nr:uncharacterized protein LOC108475214 [Gossypium arboreum]
MPNLDTSETLVSPATETGSQDRMAGDDAKGGNSIGCGQRAPDRGAGQTEASQPTLVYATHCQDGRDAPDVITDIGSTHSYVASTVSENLGILVESTSSEVAVLSPLGQSVWVSKPYRDVSIKVQGLDCATKRVILRTGEDNEVVMIGERQNYLANVISALVAKKLVRKGCGAFLAYISVSVFGDSTVKDIRTVRDFPDVFPEELPSLPPNREVEFEIELLPGTAPVSIAPYRMTLKELTELRA